MLFVGTSIIHPSTEGVFLLCNILDLLIYRWYFKNEMNTGSVEEFDGISLIEWTEDNKIKSLKEYGCNLNNYNPYQHSDNPQFRDEKISWF